MIKAEQWQKDYAKNVNVSVIRAIQLDAWKIGMNDAAKIVATSRMEKNHVTTEIVTACDARERV